MIKWFCSIERVENGYLVEFPSDDDNPIMAVFEDDESDDLKSFENLLWWLLEYFDKYGSKHDHERLRIKREIQATAQSKRHTKNGKILL